MLSLRKRRKNMKMDANRRAFDEKLGLNRLRAKLQRVSKRKWTNQRSAGRSQNVKRVVMIFGELKYETAMEWQEAQQFIICSHLKSFSLYHHQLEHSEQIRYRRQPNRRKKNLPRNGDPGILFLQLEPDFKISALFLSYSDLRSLH